MTRKAASLAIGHHAGQVVASDVRGIERNTEKTRRAGRSTRQQLSQWGRGRQETHLAQARRPLQHIDEAYSSKTCPACLTRIRPQGRVLTAAAPVASPATATPWAASTA